MVGRSRKWKGHPVMAESNKDLTFICAFDRFWRPLTYHDICICKSRQLLPKPLSDITMIKASLEGTVLCPREERIYGSSNIKQLL